MAGECLGSRSVLSEHRVRTYGSARPWVSWCGYSVLTSAECVFNLLIATPADMGPVCSRSHYGSTIITITWLTTTPVWWWKKWLILMWSREDHSNIEGTEDGWGLWCYARIKGKDQAPCGNVMITTVLLIPSLILSWGDRVMTMMVSDSCGGYEVTPNRVSGSC